MIFARFRRRLRLAVAAFLGDPSPFQRPAPHFLPRHGTLAIDCLTGARSTYDARRGVWIPQPTDVPDNGVA